jgi:hypothetical protein
MLLQRQHRQATKAKHLRLLEQHQQQQQQQQDSSSNAAAGQQQAAAAPVTLLAMSELSDVQLWDAFFDATLQVGCARGE